jgi:hypothetical protein
MRLDAELTRRARVELVISDALDDSAGGLVASEGDAIAEAFGMLREGPE